MSEDASFGCLSHLLFVYRCLCLSMMNVYPQFVCVCMCVFVRLCESLYISLLLSLKLFSCSRVRSARHEWASSGQNLDPMTLSLSLSLSLLGKVHLGSAKVRLGEGASRRRCVSTKNMARHQLKLGLGTKTLTTCKHARSCAIFKLKKYKHSTF